MKKIMLLLMALLPMLANAQYIKKGYHGFVDAGYCVTISLARYRCFGVVVPSFSL